jgi:hypothetical protein
MHPCTLLTVANEARVLQTIVAPSQLALSRANGHLTVHKDGSHSARTPLRLVPSPHCGIWTVHYVSRRSERTGRAS